MLSSSKPILFFAALVALLSLVNTVASQFLYDCSCSDRLDGEVVDSLTDDACQVAAGAPLWGATGEALCKFLGEEGIVTFVEVCEMQHSLEAHCRLNERMLDQSALY